MKKIITVFLTLIAGQVFAQVGNATLGDLANNVLNEISDLPRLFGAFAYVAGIILGIKAGLKLKEVNESKGQEKISRFFYLAIASACFLALPTLMKTGNETTGLNQASKKGFEF